MYKDDKWQTSETKPAILYTGGVFYYIPKLGLALMALLFSTIGNAVMIGGIYKIVSTLPLNNEMLALIIILFLLGINTTGIAIVFLHMYPQIGISPGHLWYRHFFIGWHAVRWKDVEEVRTAKTLFITQGTVVYSQQFPWYYRFFGRSYGRRRGKALLIPNQLIPSRELLVLLQQKGIPVKILA